MRQGKSDFRSRIKRVGEILLQLKFLRLLNAPFGFARITIAKFYAQAVNCRVAINIQSLNKNSVIAIVIV
jgi:hypothetical protein